MNKNGRTDREEADASHTEGAIDKVKGHVKEAWGDLTNDASVKREGRKDRIKGAVKEEYGDLKDEESRLERDLLDVDDEV